MGIVAWILLGSLAGLLARAALPGHAAISAAAAVLTGISGALFGGFVAELLGFGGLERFFELRSWIFAVAGALALQLVIRSAARHRGYRDPLSP
jgi:uncharacterized membrane protein YeaQ/YmgE (transglycosylase-associated protein family)